MLNLVTSLALFVALTVGGISYQVRIALSHAVIYYQDGHTEQVRVVNYGDFFCPAHCRVQHRHRVHDIRWTCPDADSCSHFTVLHVLVQPGQDRESALAAELAAH
ncbi:MAG: hypothetical protein JSU61_01935 [Fidelibacterota bacterium]|nr:MAG: hypothetical protein JSU61_01935 [Candidatus Neomarinimicrobiota bacterium]